MVSNKKIYVAKYATYKKLIKKRGFYYERITVW